MAKDRQLFLSCDDHNDFLQAAIDRKPTKVFISTFGTYLGITYDGRDTTEWGPKYRIRARDLADSMRGLPDVDILVGLADYRSCKDNGKAQCVNCEKQYIRTLIRLMNHVDVFSEFNWKMTTELHIKCSLFSYDESSDEQEREIIAVSGGRNFTSSEFDDVTFSLSYSEIRQIWKRVKPLWDKGLDVTNESIGEMLETQGISPRGFEAVLHGIEDAKRDEPDKSLPF